MAKSKQSIIVGTSTDIGKTFLTCKIIEEYRESKIDINVVKPIITGFDINDEDCDSVKILKTLETDITIQNIDLISPFRLKTPISPISAARIEDTQIHYSEILEFCQNKISKSLESGVDLIIESAGGLMTPICKGKSFLDLVKDLDIDVILVGACFLGGISNILTNYECLKSKNIQNIEIIVNNHVDFDDKFLKIDDFIDEIGYFVDCKVFLVDNFFYLK